MPDDTQICTASTTQRSLNLYNRVRDHQMQIPCSSSNGPLLRALQGLPRHNTTQQTHHTTPQHTTVPTPPSLSNTPEVHEILGDPGNCCLEHLKSRIGRYTAGNYCCLEGFLENSGFRGGETNFPAVRFARRRENGGGSKQQWIPAQNCCLEPPFRGYMGNQRNPETVA